MRRGLQFGKSRNRIAIWNCATHGSYEREDGSDLFRFPTKPHGARPRPQSLPAETFQKVHASVFPVHRKLFFVRDPFMFLDCTCDWFKVRDLPMHGRTERKDPWMLSFPWVIPPPGISYHTTSNNQRKKSLNDTQTFYGASQFRHEFIIRNPLLIMQSR